MIAENLDIIRLSGGYPFLFGKQPFDHPAGKMLGVTVSDEVIGNVTIELADLTLCTVADLAGRVMLPGVLFHHMSPDMRGIMRYIARNVVNHYIAHNAPTNLGLVSIPSDIPIISLFRNLPFTCTVDVGHLVSYHPPLFERLKPYLYNGQFELTEDLYVELRLGL